MDSDVIPRHGLGTAPLGGLFTEVGAQDAAATVQAAIDNGLRYFDTAPLYGHGLAEARLGKALRSCGVPRAQLSVSTKVGRVLVPGLDPGTTFRGVPRVRPEFDFSAAGIQRSLEESLTRLGLDHADLVLVHDPDDHENEALATAFPALVHLRDQGVIGAIGVGMNQTAMLSRFASKADDIGLDYVLAAGRWTLLDQTAGSTGGLLDTCAAHGVRVIIGGVFNSGLLADPRDGAMFDYGPAAAPQLNLARKMAQVCASFGVSLASAALQFPWRHNAVSTIIVGARSAAEVCQNHSNAATDIPESLWDELGSIFGLDIPPGAHTP